MNAFVRGAGSKTQDEKCPDPASAILEKSLPPETESKSLRPTERRDGGRAYTTKASAPMECRRENL